MRQFESLVAGRFYFMSRRQESAGKSQVGILPAKADRSKGLISISGNEVVLGRSLSKAIVFLATRLQGSFWRSEREYQVYERGTAWRWNHRFPAERAFRVQRGVPTCVQMFNLSAYILTMVHYKDSWCTLLDGFISMYPATPRDWRR